MRKSSINLPISPRVSPINGSLISKTSPESRSCSPSRNPSSPSANRPKLSSRLKSKLLKISVRSGNSKSKLLPLVRSPRNFAKSGTEYLMSPTKSDSLGKNRGRVESRAPVKLTSAPISANSPNRMRLSPGVGSIKSMENLTKSSLVVASPSPSRATIPFLAKKPKAPTDASKERLSARAAKSTNSSVSARLRKETGLEESDRSMPTLSFAVALPSASRPASPCNWRASGKPANEPKSRSTAKDSLKASWKLRLIVKTELSAS